MVIDIFKYISSKNIWYNEFKINYEIRFWSYPSTHVHSQKHTVSYQSLWAGRTQAQWGRRTACRGWWRSRWSRAGGGAGGSDKWCRGRVYLDSKHNTPSVSSSCNPSSPTPRSPWNYWGLVCRCPYTYTKRCIYILVHTISNVQSFIQLVLQRGSKQFSVNVRDFLFISH